MSYCPNCKTSLNAGDINCPACGQISLVADLPGVQDLAALKQAKFAAQEARWAAAGLQTIRPTSSWVCTVLIGTLGCRKPAIRQEQNTARGWCAAHWPPPPEHLPQGGEE